MPGGYSRRTMPYRRTPPSRTAIPRRAALAATALVGAALALAGCGALGSADATGTATATADTTADGTAGTTTTAEEVRETGTALTVGDVTVHVAVGQDTAEPSSTVDEDGATTLTVTAGTDGTFLLIAPPAGTAASDVAELADGSVVLRTDGTFAAGVTATATDGSFTPTSTVQEDGLVIWSGDAGTQAAVTVATAAVRSATWADRDDEGGLSLAVVPTTWARTGGLAAEEGVWAQLVALEPDADTQAMHDQLTCHTIGAPDKESWNLEPWRPDVGLLATLAARCNPTG